MSTVLTTQDVIRATQLIEPSALRLLTDPNAVWGPQYVMVSLRVNCLRDTFSFAFGTIPRVWRPEWGPEFGSKDFEKFAGLKRALAERGQGPTSRIIVEKPWFLVNGDILRPGGTWRDGISVGVSGIKSEADEMIAEWVADAVAGVARLKARQYVEAGFLTLQS